MLERCDLLLCSDLDIFLTQTPDDPHPDEPEYAQHPLVKQLKGSTRTERLSKGWTQKIDQRMEQNGQE